MKPTLLIKLLRWLDRAIEQVARTGTETPCAAGFCEWAKDFGPIAFLFNCDRDWVCCETEVQVFGRPAFHAGGDAYGEFWASVFGFSVKYEPPAEKEVDWPDTLEINTATVGF